MRWREDNMKRAFFKQVFLDRKEVIRKINYFDKKIRLNKLNLIFEILYEHKNIQIKLKRVENRIVLNRKQRLFDKFKIWYKY
mmetsp:Transcript_9514/g.8377  ORF Transcript_9514/g.8377 Transcript_9514/m.8377 type:complete len:82 (+) Transcript_9514:412-657(+)